jgi:predicted aminopeptidase
MKSIILLFLFISCAKVSYIFEQGIGQVSLEYGDIDNEDFLSDKNQLTEHKRKVELIIKTKKYFYDYYKISQTDIYDEVKILNSKAVTYLVIHSSNDKVKAIETSFPIIGSFPYLGFFKKDSALEFKNKKEDLGFHTYIRNVYAYSTLNHPMLPMDDNILSSFFYYNDEDLVKLIFHELVHTILFVKDNVGFNENLAEFISEKMLVEYLNIDLKSAKRRKQKELNSKVRKHISSSSVALNKLYKDSNDSALTLSKFLKESFVPNGKVICKIYNLKNCLFEDNTWNNARFAAYGTYEEKRDELDTLFKQKNIKLKEFVFKLINYNIKFDPSMGSFLLQIKKDL